MLRHPSVGASDAVPVRSEVSAGSSEPGPPSLDLRIFLLAVFFLPVQLEVGGSFENIIESRFAPSDLLLALVVVLAPGVLKLGSRPVELLPLGMVATLAYGIVLAVVWAGAVTQHALLVKFFGGVVLAVLGLVTVAYARAGWSDRILRVFLAGMAFWGVLAYVDQYVVDLFPFLTPKVESRFGGMQFDPNNAGAAYGVAAILAWTYGGRLYGRFVHWTLVATLLSGMALSYSRGALIATAAAVVVVLVVERPSAQKWVRMAMAAAVIAVAALALGYVDNASEDFERRPDTVAEREVLASRGMDDLVESRGLGIGLGTYRDDVGDIIHNTALWLVVEMSLVGAAFLLAVAVVPVVAALGMRRRNAALGSALLGAHVVMLVASLNIEALYQRHWWLVFGLLSMPRRTEKPTAPGRPEPVSSQG